MCISLHKRWGRPAWESVCTTICIRHNGFDRSWSRIQNRCAVFPQLCRKWNISFICQTISIDSSLIWALHMLRLLNTWQPEALMHNQMISSVCAEVARSRCQSGSLKQLLRRNYLDLKTSIFLYLVVLEFHWHFNKDSYLGIPQCVIRVPGLKPSDEQHFYTVYKITASSGNGVQPICFYWDSVFRHRLIVKFCHCRWIRYQKLSLGVAVMAMATGHQWQRHGLPHLLVSIRRTLMHRLANLEARGCFATHQVNDFGIYITASVFTV